MSAGCAPYFLGGTQRRAFLLFTLGMLTHYELDVLMIGVAGGLALLYPFTWETWHFDLIQPNNWLGTTMLVSGAVVLRLVLKVWRRTEPSTQDETTSGA